MLFKDKDHIHTIYIIEIFLLHITHLQNRDINRIVRFRTIAYLSKLRLTCYRGNAINLVVLKKILHMSVCHHRRRINYAKRKIYSTHPISSTSWFSSILHFYEYFYRECGIHECLAFCYSKIKYTSSSIPLVKCSFYSFFSF